MELNEIQSISRELEADSKNLESVINRISRIAHSRFDIKELLFCKLNKIKLVEKNIKIVQVEVRQIALKKGISKELYLKIFNEIYSFVLNTRKVITLDDQHELDDRNVMILAVSQIVVELKHYEEVLKNNTIPDGLASLDLYQANQNKQRLDHILQRNILNKRTILNEIKDYLLDYLISIENEHLQKKELETMDVRERLEELIAEGYSISQNDYTPLSHDLTGDYISSDNYVAWLHKCKIFIKKNVSDIDIYNEFNDVAKNANGNGQFYFDQVIGLLVALKTYDFKEETQLEKIRSNNKIDKIFISHSVKDVEYVKSLVQLLNDIGIKKSENYIFCSSLSGYGIPYGESIFEFLKEELNKSNIMVLFVLSHNYYQSPPCLNEMGAAWITSKSYNSILTPNFDFRHISGAIDSSKISFHMHDENGLNTFKDKIVKLFELEEIDYKIWGEDRKRFIETIKGISYIEATNLNTQVQVEKVKKLNDEELELQLRFINVTDKDIEFKFIDFELVDSFGNEIQLLAEDKYLENYTLYRKENKVVKWVFQYDYKSNYNPRRDNGNLSKVSFEIYS
ncbi:toll/interleukin-1 receptor domain-containing protein [Shouchella oshimensis]|uniref:toll/interleukin-1 receptor domain-containing protein n=1 Tax=Shouchella oshimensis TaxID=290588 RepID=UPI001FEC1696|nr:toll/interleukin-1 receptor domain-containing protein [Shouchella oshimensis]